MASPEFLFNKEYLSWLLAAASVDHDGVMADTRTSVTNVFNEDFHTNHTPDEIRNWNTVRDWALAENLSFKDAQRLNDYYWHDPDILFTAKPLPGAYEFIYRAYARGYEIPVVSSRFPKLRESTIEWYRANDMGFVKPEDIYTCLEDTPDGDLSKTWMVKLLRRRLHIEDTPGHAKLILDFTPARVFLLSNTTELDSYAPGRLNRFGSPNGTMPDLWPIYRLFFTENHKH